MATRDGKPPSFLEIAGEDQKFEPALGAIEGDALIVRNDGIPKPIAVRYAWEEHAVPNLMNKKGLPVAPFRTDSWKSSCSTEHKPQAKVRHSDGQITL